MKKVLLTLLVVLPFALMAQECEPDPFYADSTGVFPLPKSDTNPSGGITECAIIGEPYKFVFTVAVGDSIDVPILGQQKLDKVVVDSISGLPIGINYVCESDSGSDCVFEDNTLGCAALTGTPLSSNAPGDYSLKIYATVFFAPPAFPSSVALEFPGPFYPGDYTLKLLSDSSQDCDIVGSANDISNQVALSVNPNPNTGFFQVEIESSLFGGFDLSLTDLLGRKVHNEKVNLVSGSNRVTVDGASLNNGLYILVLENELGQVSQKVLIQH